MPRYIVPAWLIVEAETPADALRVADEELAYLCKGNDRAPYYDLPETDATITPEGSEDYDLDAPHILPEDYALHPTRQLTDTERAVLRGMLP